MKDFENKKINIYDDVIYLKTIRTGSSSIRKCMFRGKVKGFTNTKVIIEPMYSNEFKIREQEDKIFPRDVYRIGQ